MKRFLLAATAVAGVVVLAGCNSSTTGAPSPITDGDSQSAAASTTAPPSSSGGGGSGGGGSTSLPASDPCSLFTSAALQQLGATGEPTKDEIGGAPDCSVDVSNGNVGATVMVDRGLSQLSVQGQVTDVTVGSHQAKKMLYSMDSSDCVVAIGVTSSSRVDVSFEADGGVDACGAAMQAAALVEPRLPSGG